MYKMYILLAIINILGSLLSVGHYFRGGRYYQDLLGAVQFYCYFQGVTTFGDRYFWNFTVSVYTVSIRATDYMYV